ncbi:hypothetical protein NFJ02_08g138350 [Pycnococcus provasolii]
MLVEACCKNYNMCVVFVSLLAMAHLDMTFFGGRRQALPLGRKLRHNLHFLWWQLTRRRRRGRKRHFSHRVPARQYL